MKSNYGRLACHKPSKSFRDHFDETFRGDKSVDEDLPILADGETPGAKENSTEPDTRDANILSTSVLL